MRHLLIAGLLLASSTALAENMQTAGSLAAGDLALGAEFQAGLFQGNPLTLNLHESVGLRGGFDLYAREDIGMSNDAPNFYVGAGIKWTLMSNSRSRPGIAFLFGGHFYTDADIAGADAAFLLDFRVGRVTPFAGLDFNLEFFDNDAQLFLTINGGARISVATNVSWFVEGGLGVSGEPKRHYVVTGPRISI
jgi:hypothetical protein